MEIKLPKFLLSEEPTGDMNRFVYIYSPVYMSLILIVAEDSQTVILNDEYLSKPRKTFKYEYETFEFIIIQNNVKLTGGQLAPEISEPEFLNQAWAWYEEYLKWEDNNIDNDSISKLN
ncbi:hypothetical protein HZQ14_15825 [Elizabethkingia anophelis]|nr:hypothetical protein [Elizabethkingia anophelis]